MQPENSLLQQLLVDGLPDYAVILLDTSGNVLRWNAGAQRIKGYTPAEIVGQHFSRFYTADDKASGKPAAALRRALTEGRYEETGLRMRKDGRPFHAHLILVPLFDTQGKHIGFGKLTRDVSAQIAAEAEQRRLHRFLDVVLETMIDGVIVIDIAGNIRTYNRACEGIFGYSAEEAIGQNIRMLMPEPTRSEHDGHLQHYRETGKRRLVGTPREVVAQRKDGTTLPVSIAIGEAQIDGESLFVGVIHDLRSTKAVEAELRQSQRLTAIGQLTGGIAHDFNNILMVIMVAAEGLAGDLQDDPQVMRRINRITNSATRAADLIRQLLAFARKQPLKPQISNFNEIVAATTKMLGRTLGDHVVLESVLIDELWPTSIDRAQFEAALINLCVNARDAMPEGGRLMIETSNVVLDEHYARRNADVVPGDYVLLAVSDTGVGIPPDLLERVFEPFFTTKEVGKGTGLGLSMVYGFIKQSNGHIKIYSEQGHGTTIRLYLPRVEATPTNGTLAPAAVLPKGTERVLVVEDDRDVLESVVEQLRSLGYDVGEANDGTTALQRLGRDPAYALLLTDVIMPGPINGRALADAATQRQPGLRVLYMSGYTQNAIVHHGRLDPGVRLLNKPFSKAELARAVRAALDDDTDGISPNPTRTA